jgi:predicted enzyme related to lactoylglutathione lyase
MVLDLPGLSSIGQISIPVQDIDRGVKFHQESLGMDHLFQVPGTAFFDCSGIRIMLGVLEENGAVQSGPIIYFMVDAIHDSTRAFQEKGVVFPGEPHLVAELPDHDPWMSFFQDPDCNVLALRPEIGKLDQVDNPR